MKPSLIIRYALGILFIYASVNKIKYPEEFLKILYNYRIFPEFSLPFIAVILPWLELCTGICLITGIFIEGATVLINLFLFLFFLIILVDMIRGINIECGCFNLHADPSARNSMLWYLIRDLFFLSMSMYLIKDLWKKGKKEGGL